MLTGPLPPPPCSSPLPPHSPQPGVSCLFVTMSRTAAILAFLASGVSAQSCYYRNSDCLSCAGVNGASYEGKCAWALCGDGYSSCSSASSGSTYCGSSPLQVYATTSAQCPTPKELPTAQAFSWSNAPTWGLVALAGVSTLVLAVYVYMPFNTPALNTAVPFSFVHVLTTASVFLWISATTLLAAPTLPWVASVQRSSYDAHIIFT